MEERRKGPWTVQESVERFRSKLLTVRDDKVLRPDGTPGRYATAAIPPGVLALAVDSDGHAYLTKQYRYAVEMESIEAAAGSMEGDDTPLAAARRELREELGITAEEWVELGRVCPVGSLVSLEEHLFLARGLSFQESEQEGAERIEPLKVPFAEALEMAVDGRIVSPSTCTLILRASRHLAR